MTAAFRRGHGKRRGQGNRRVEGERPEKRGSSRLEILPVYLRYEKLRCKILTRFARYIQYNTKHLESQRVLIAKSQSLKSNECKSVNLI